MCNFVQFDLYRFRYLHVLSVVLTFDITRNPNTSIAMQIGPYKLANKVIAAPMAGVSDKPYRQVCREHGAGLVVSEMVTSRIDLQHTSKSKYRLDLAGEPGPVVV